MDMVKAGSQGKTLKYIHDLADPAVQESVILLSPRSPAALEQDAQRGFRSEAQVTLEFRRTDQKAMRARGGDVLFEYHAGDSITGATYTRTTGGTYPGVASTADFGYGTVTTAAANKLRVGWYSSKSSAGPRTIPATLLEPARKNLIKWSQNFATDKWTPVNAADSAASSGQSDPLGGTNAWKLSVTNNTSTVAVQFALSTVFATSTFAAMSVFLKQGSASTYVGSIRMNTTGAGASIHTDFRFSSGVFILSTQSGGTYIGAERWRDGWYRVSARSTAAYVGANNTMTIYNNQGFFGGSSNMTTGHMFVFGAQVECT